MIKTIVLFTFFLVSIALFAQKPVIAFRAMDGKWGFSSPTGEIIIKPQYLDVHSCTKGGVALVKEFGSKEWEIINLKNEKVKIPFPKYNFLIISKYAIRPFSSEVLTFNAQKKMACLDSTGTILHSPLYDRIYPFKGDYTVAERDKAFFFLDKKGSEYKIETDAGWVGKIHGGFAQYRAKGLFGVLTLDGKVHIEAKFDKLGHFIDGIAWARSTNGLIGYINTKGEWIIEPQYTAGGDMSATSKMAKVRVEDQKMYVNSQGEILKVEGMTSGGPFIPNVTWITKEKKNGFINKVGEVVVPFEFDRVEKYNGSVYNVRKGKLWGVVNGEGELVVEPYYTAIEQAQEGRIGVRVGKKWGFIDLEGNSITEIKFDTINQFKNGYAAVRIADKWGLIDLDGNIVLEPNFKRVNDPVMVGESHF